MGMRCGFVVLSLAILSAGLIGVGGCSTATYLGASPSARYFNETPAIKDYYLGMNFQFAIDRLSEYHCPPQTPASTASTAAPAPTSHAESSLAPAGGD